jgi:hypothetical protein
MTITSGLTPWKDTNGLYLRHRYVGKLTPDAISIRESDFVTSCLVHTHQYRKNDSSGLLRHHVFHLQI